MGQVDFDKLDKQIAGENSASEQLQLLVNGMAEAFNLEEDDVTVLMETNGVLMFQHPKALSRSTVPITLKSVAGQTFKNNKIYVYNNLNEIQHVELFEQFVQKEGNALPVQRMISCPIPGKTGPKGVLQVCRKGKTRDDAAPFTRADANTIISLAKIAGTHLPA